MEQNAKGKERCKTKKGDIAYQKDVDPERETRRMIEKHGRDKNNRNIQVKK